MKLTSVRVWRNAVRIIEGIWAEATTENMQKYEKYA